jgi:hypothetical protein
VSGGEFKPKNLDRESLEAPLEPQWRVMGADQEKRLYEKSREDYRRFQVFGPRMRRRLRIYVLGTAAGFAAVGWFAISGTLRSLLVFGGLGALLGAVVAFLRPSDFLCGLLYAITAIVAELVVFKGGGLGALIMIMSSALFFGIVGIACGRMEEFKRFDGED